MRSPSTRAPVPPVPLPRGCVVPVAGRGEFFVRDTGGSGRPVLLLHGWMFPADPNWFPVYGPLRRAGHRVIALDHRGHGRGLRTTAPFRLTDCADDAAAVLRELGVGPAVVVGYSMGGPIAQLLARDHRDAVGGLVLCSTAQDWQDWWMKGLWRSLSVLRLALGLFPVRASKSVLALARVPRGSHDEWLAGELSRGSSIDIAEAGRELSRYDARPWIAQLRDLPGAVIVTTHDRTVRPRKQRHLAAALDAPVFEVAGDHFAVVARADAFRAALLAALDVVGAPQSGAVAA